MNWTHAVQAFGWWIVPLGIAVYVGGARLGWLLVGAILERRAPGRRKQGRQA
jgi:hypothetical protein